MVAQSPTLLIFVDGLGIASPEPKTNLVYSGAAPTLARLMTAHAAPLDATLGVEGLPQSATGQATLLTGINAAAAAGRHVEGFPTPRLREIIRAENIFRKLLEHGKTATFANAYYVDDTETVRRSPLQSVTTVATLSGLGAVRDRHALQRDDAVYHDFTRQALRERGYKGPLISSQTAAEHLVRIATGFDFTLFEHFQTDRAGHSGDPGVIRPVLTLLDRFLAALLPLADQAGILVVITSDHGNIEDVTCGHTRNPVPLVAAGPKAEEILDGPTSLVDVTPALLRVIVSAPTASPAPARRHAPE
jgi:hypothetical protein